MRKIKQTTPADMASVFRIVGKTTIFSTEQRLVGLVPASGVCVRRLSPNGQARQGWAWRTWGRAPTYHDGRPKNDFSGGRASRTLGVVWVVGALRSGDAQTEVAGNGGGE